MFKLKNRFIIFSIEYFIWFLTFMLCESFANSRVSEVIGSDKVELLYAIFIVFSAAGFASFTILNNKINNYKRNKIILYFLINGIAFNILAGSINNYLVVIICSATLLSIVGCIGAKIMYQLWYEYKEDSNCGLIVGISMAVSIIVQYVIQNIKTSNIMIMTIVSILLLIILIMEEKSKNYLIDKQNVIIDNKIIFEKNRMIVNIIAVGIMTVILSLNDAYLVDLSARVSVGLFGWVRLFYALSLVIAGFVYDYKQGIYFNIVVSCAMMLSTVAYVFLGQNTNFNINMSIMYFYCGFYVMFLTMHFIGCKRKVLQDDNCIQGFITLIPSVGRIVRCLVTSVVTLSMIVIGNNISVQALITISCILSIGLVLLLVISDFIKTKNNNEEIEKSLIISEFKIESDKLYNWKSFTEKYSFTDRECDVLQKLINTEDNLQDISEQLFISKRVVQRHITSIYEKTGKTTRIGLLQLYVEHLNETT